MSLLFRASPKLSVDTAVSLAKQLYGIDAAADVLPSERDQNFLLRTPAAKYVLKIANGLEDHSFLVAQNAVMVHLSRRLSYTPRVVPRLNGELIGRYDPASNLTHFVRLVTFLPGRPLGDTAHQSLQLLSDVGAKLGVLDRELASFDHPALRRKFHWDIAEGLNVINEYLHLISDAALQQLVFDCVIEYGNKVGPLTPSLRRSVIHNDANDYNLLVDTDADGLPSVSGIIDFGDIVFTYTVSELAVAVAYAVLNVTDPLRVADCLVSGYCGSNLLNNAEIEALFQMVKLRLCMSLCLAAYQQLQQPDNQYLQISQQAVRTTLPRLAAIDSEEATSSFYRARASRENR